ncbi:succinyl-diaminopimelate desuccinylase [Micromonospora sp. RTGN7]|uniref:succinyl-diaminopimelate desuccinylase n=1 Tax=Micromonospora sp. RTGN7 TaxID=3016526 RepID=UPI0029FEF8E1|nr:succinyl-diaminopimelate desuccinylase [Micromonospora sp. RTGN7]
MSGPPLAPVVRADTVFDLTAALVAVGSVSRDEAGLADLVEARLTGRAPHLRVTRVGNNVVARTAHDRPTRVMLAGHLDTVPGVPPTGPPASGDVIEGLGAVDMKGGVAVMLMLAELVRDPAHDLTFVFYDREEIGSHQSGMRLLFDEHRELVTADAAVLLEPTDGLLEAGCQGNLVVEFTFTGARAHTARPWRGRNAVHLAIPALARFAAFEPPPVEIDGLVYRQSASVVAVTAGVQGNVVPDRCTVKVNYRHAPHLGTAAAIEELTALAPEADEVHVLLTSPPAAPALTHPLLSALRRTGGLDVRPKLGWTDVGRFAAHGIPAVNFGPGDSELAHTPHEVVSRDALGHCLAVLHRFVGATDRTADPT